MESLGIEHPAFNALLRMARDIRTEGNIVSVRTLLAMLDRKNRKSAQERALWDRLLWIEMEGGPGFLVDEGFDLKRLFERSVVFELKEASESMRKLIYNDHYSYLVRSGK